MSGIKESLLDCAVLNCVLIRASDVCNANPIQFRVCSMMLLLLSLLLSLTLPLAFFVKLNSMRFVLSDFVCTLQEIVYARAIIDDQHTCRAFGMNV